MKTRTALFATTALVATLAAAGAAIAHPGMGRGMGQGMGPGMGQGSCQMQQPGAQCPQGAGPAAGAHQGTGPGKGMGMGKGSGMRGGPAATNLADVKTTLKITAEQDGAWNAYAAVETRHADARNNMRDKMQAQHADPKATLPDRSAMQETMLQFRQEMQTQRTAALKDLYAVLTPEQKALADQNLNGMGGMRGMRGQGMAGPMGGGRMAHPVGHRMGGQGGMGMGMGMGSR
jgi:Spy/CpxP family protein refolding chaperone